MYKADLCHENIAKTRKPILKFDETKDYESWKQEVKATLTRLLGDMPEKCPLDIKQEWEKEYDDFVEKRLIFTSEQYVEIPCHLWIPKNIKKPCPCVICLQGHSSGMHISMGRVLNDGDEISLKDGDRDFAKQIIKQGYAALVMEQRGFGEKKSEAELARAPKAQTGCTHIALTAILQGRTLIGERCWDISRAIDMLEQFDEIDSKRIAVMGNSGGGTASYYAACMDERIKIVMPSCGVCSYKESILALKHCTCNYIPNIAKYVDMGELACLIAPRQLVMVSGEKDHGFFIAGAREVYKTIETIYKKAGAENNCRMVTGSEGHRFYADISWPVFNELCKWQQD